MYGNYIDGYDIVDENGAEVYLDYDLSLVTENLSAGEIDADLDDFTYSIDGQVTVTNASVTVDFSGDNIQLIEGAQIGVAFNFVSNQYSGTPGYNDGTQPENIFETTFIFNLPQDYASVYEMATSTEFVEAVSSFTPPADSDCFPEIGNVNDSPSTSLTDLFICGIVPKSGWRKENFGISAINQGFDIIANQGSTEITFIIPAFQFQELDTSVPQPYPPTGNYAYEYFNAVSAEGLYSLDGSKRSLHSNRGS